MAKFTVKKKQAAMGEAMRDIHVLARAIRQRGVFVKENRSMILEPEDVKSFNELMQKCGYFVSRMDKLYKTDERSIKFLHEKNGESAIDELSLRVLDYVDGLTKNFTVNDTKPE